MANYADATCFPLPPPWQLLSLNGRDAYMNDITGSIVDEHPLQTLINQLKEEAEAGHNQAAQAAEVTAQGAGDEGSGEAQEQPDMGSPASDGPKAQRPRLDKGRTSPPPTKGSPKGHGQGQGQQHASDRSVGSGTVTTLDSALDSVHFVEFRCNWKESGLFGNCNAFGLVIRYFGDQRCMIRFDGVDARWEYSLLEGPHGPLGRYDLFVGARVKVFGRQLTISSCTATVCHANEMEGKRLLKKQAWLQTRIESLGGTPVIRRTSDAGGTVVRNIQRSSKSYGSVNLRRIHNENFRLKDQLAGMGMARVVQEYEAAELLGKKHRKAANFEGRLLYEELHELQPDL